MEEHVKQEQVFDLTSGLLCLDFANTVEDRTNIHPQELLVIFEDLIRWSRQTQVLTEQEGRELSERPRNILPKEPEFCSALLK